MHAEVALLGQTHYLESERGKERGQVVRVSSQLSSAPVAETEGEGGGMGTPLCVTSLWLSSTLAQSVPLSTLK